MYHPAEWGPTFNRPRRSCFHETRTPVSGSEGGRSSFNTSLKYIKVGFGGAGSNHSLSAAAQINVTGPEPPAPLY